MPRCSAALGHCAEIAGALNPSWPPARRPAIPTLHPRTGGRHWAALEAAAAVDPEAAAAKLFSKVASNGGWPGVAGVWELPWCKGVREGCLLLSFLRPPLPAGGAQRQVLRAGQGGGGPV